jgi:CheY-like chemotaxis protein
MDDRDRWRSPVTIGGRRVPSPASAARVRLEAADRRRTLNRLVADARRLHAESRDRARRAPAGGPHEEGRLDGPRILVIDDDALIRDALRLLLEELGARVTEAAGGSEALQRLETGRFDLVLCDLRMPDVDGFAVIRRIRGDRRWRDLPVVAVSAVGPGAGPDRTREAGFDARLHKPFDLNDLVEALDSAGRRAA